MSEIERKKPPLPAGEPDARDDDDEPFDVQAWFVAYLADADAQAEHADHAGVPFH